MIKLHGKTLPIERLRLTYTTEPGVIVTETVDRDGLTAVLRSAGCTEEKISEIQAGIEWTNRS